MKAFLICVFIVAGFSFVTDKHPYIDTENTNPPADSLFVDTLYPIVTTSFNPDFGELHECPKRIRHYYKYIGDTPGIITRNRTSDPQFIGKNSGMGAPLQKDSIYYFDVAFPWHNRLGKARRYVGMEINNESHPLIRFYFSFNLVADTCERNN